MEEKPGAASTFLQPGSNPPVLVEYMFFDAADDQVNDAGDRSEDEMRMVSSSSTTASLPSSWWPQSSPSSSYSQCNLGP